MEIKLAKESLKADCKSKSITFEKMEEVIEANGKKGAIFYLDRENQEKDIRKMETFFKNKNRSTIIRELHYSMDNKDYVYEVHIL